MTGNEADLPADQKCSDWGFCEQPTLTGPVYTMDSPGCNPYAVACGMQALFSAEFPGNHQNKPSSIGFTYSYVTLDMFPVGSATAVGSCGVPGSPITEDLGDGRASANVTCDDPGGGLYLIRAITCKSANPASCIKTEELQLDFATAAGCIVPPMQQCGTEDASCRECLAGGVGVGGGGHGVGGPGGPKTGPGAQLRYSAGGAGHPGLPGSATWAVTLGRYWSHDYAERIVPLPDETKVWLITRYGTYRQWSTLDGGSGIYQDVAPSSEKRQLRWLGADLGWELTGLDGTVDLYDDQGRWTSRRDRNWNETFGTYPGSQLTRVTFPDGRHEDFTYDPTTGKLATITEVGLDASTRTWTYSWSDAGAGDDLERIGRPDDTALLFIYDEPVNGYMTRMELEGTDGTSVRVLRGWEYDADGNVIRTWAGDTLPTGVNAVDSWELAFDDPGEPTVTTVTDPLGQEITYQLGRDTVSKNVKVLQIDGDCPICGLAPNARLDYIDSDNPLLPTSIVDGRGIITRFTYDGSGQTLNRSEADGGPLQRLTTWTYDTTYPALVTSVEQPSVVGGASMRATDWMLDGSGNATKRTISGVEAGSAFAYQTNTTYNAAGQPLVIDPDGHGAEDQTVFTYDAMRGDLFPQTRTDPVPVGSTPRTTTFGYDGFNRWTSVTEPDGVTSTMAYDQLDRVTEVRQEGASPPTDDLGAGYTYNTFGDLFQQTELHGPNVIEYGYDLAGRLISVERKPDAVTHGERVSYTLDGAGNRTREAFERWDTDASAWVTFASTAYEYTNRCQADRIVQAPQTPEEAATTFAYDCNGNVSAQWDANHNPDVDPPTTTYDYDALDRLTSVSQPWEGPGGGDAVTSYGYDVQDHLVEVTDAEGNAMNYEYSDRDLLTSERLSFLVPPGSSCALAPVCDPTPGCGCTTHGYDQHGELVTTTDARGITIAREVDPLDRVTRVLYPDNSLDTSFSYDTAPASCSGSSFPVGRLGAITRGGQAIDYCYDRFGHLTRDGDLTFLYDSNGSRTGIGYPGGVDATYGFDFAHREVSLSVTSAGGTEPVVSAVSYLPSGPVSLLVLGNTATETRRFDQRYAPTAIGLSGPGGGVGDRSWTYTTDHAGNVLGIVEQNICLEPPLLLENRTVAALLEPISHCSSIEAGPGYVIDNGGDVTFDSGGSVVLRDGFSVLAGGAFTAISAASELSHRSYTYQPPQYFLTTADGPWGSLDWTYDKIGNRLTESRDQGATQDSYQYLTNTRGGNTPLLDVVNLAVGNTRDYAWGAAGNLEQVAAGANVLDFNADGEGRFSAVDRAVADEGALFAYDGRSFLRSAQELSGDPPVAAASVTPLYDSAGRVHALRHRPSPSDPEELALFFYLTGRPVAQLAIDGSGLETWTYLTPDHLGTPLLATDDAGGVVWEGGFEPFGTDYQANSMAGALENSLYLRLPGQWDNGTWSNATSGAGVYYNVYRWYGHHDGNYTRPDPVMGRFPRFPYGYGDRNPLRYYDSSGLFTVDQNCVGPLSGCQVDPHYSGGLDQLNREVSLGCSRLSKIQDLDLRNCLDDSCKHGTIECNGKGCTGTKQGNNNSRCWQTNHNAILCVGNWPNKPIPPGAMGHIVFHEWGHGCGRERYDPHDPLWDPFTKPGRKGEGTTRCWLSPWLPLRIF